MQTINEAWAEILSYLHQLADISEVGFNTWLSCIEPRNIENGELVLFVQTSFQKKMVREHYADRITEACENVLGVPMNVKLLCGDDDLKEPEKPEWMDISVWNQVSEFSNSEEDTKYSFENFIVGSSNKFAHAAAQAVADSPAGAYNPLFIYGGSGLGKTHLLYAICNHIRRHDPYARILYTKGEDMANELIASLRENAMPEFRSKYRLVDILLVDDIQFIAGKTSTQEEFFHTFDALYQANKQIVLVSDRPPKEIATLEDRLRTRFESGLLADIQPPDFETRVAIVKRKANLMNFHMSDTICEYLAEQLKGNVRQLEGAVKTIHAQCLLSGESPSLFYAQNAIRDTRNNNQPVPVTVDKIIDEVARTMNVSADDIRSQKRSAPISQARQVAEYVVRTITNLSMEEIGRHFSNRDHSSVFYAIREVEKRMTVDSAFKNLINDIVKNVNSM